MLLQPGEKAIGVLKSMTCLPVPIKTFCETQVDVGRRKQCSVDKPGFNRLIMIAARSKECCQTDQICYAFKLIQFAVKAGQTVDTHLQTSLGCLCLSLVWHHHRMAESDQPLEVCCPQQPTLAIAVRQLTHDVSVAQSSAAH